MMKTVVWSKDDCPYCVRAKQLLDSKNIPYEDRNISSGDWTREQLLESVPTARTVPQIFMYGIYVGGCYELERYFEDRGMWNN